MYIQKKAIDMLVTCRVCQSLFKDPRILPCGHTFCRDCIDFTLLNQTTDRVRCPDCHVQHAYDPSGYIINLRACALLAIEPPEIVQCDEAKELKEKLKEFNAKRDLLVQTLNSDIDETKEYCNTLRIQTALNTEMRVSEIRNEGKDLKSRLRKYSKSLPDLASLLRGERDAVEAFKTYIYGMESLVEELKEFAKDDDEAKMLEETFTEYLIMLENLKLDNDKLRSESVDSTNKQ